MLKLSNICKSIAAVFVAASASLAVEVWDGSVAESFAEGKGTVAEPYKISNGAELALFAQRVAAGEVTLNGELTGDIYLNDSSFAYRDWIENPPVNNWTTPIGMNGKPYVGSFDGKGHKVYGMYQDVELSANLNSTGLFGWIGAGSRIQNIAVEESFSKVHGNIASTHNSHNGLLFGASNGGRIVNVQVQGFLQTSATNVDKNLHILMTGCLAGYVSDGSAIINASATCEMESALPSGSIGTVQHCLGGLVGKTYKSFIQNAYANGSIENSFATMPSELYVGGVVGFQSNAVDTLYNAYYNTSATNAPSIMIGKGIGVIKNVSGKTAIKMKTENFAALLGSGFTYSSTKNDDYPFPVVFEGSAAFDGGDGSEASPYLIGSAKALRAVSGLVNGMNAEFGGKSYKMTADVELNEDSETYKSWETTPPEFSWTQIGMEYHRKSIDLDCNIFAISCGDAVFSGTFDGAGNAIKGLFVDDVSGNSQGGLFYAVAGGEIKNLTVEQSFVRTKGRASGFVAVADSAIIENCTNGADIHSISQDNAGIVAVASSSLITHCVNKGDVEVVNKGVRVWSNGGIAGEIFRNAEISYCTNEGNVYGLDRYNGGILGLANNSSVHDVYNTGSVKGDSLTGGVVGGLEEGSLKSAYNIGSVATTKNASRGGVVGLMSNAKDVVADCYYDSQKIGSTNAPTAAIGKTTGTVSEVSALTTAQMKSGMFAIMLGESYKQDDALNDGYPVFLEEGETYGAEHLFAGGKGTADDPYQIATATQLRNMEYLVNKKNVLYADKYYKLIADISLNENTADYLTWETTAPANVWTPMGVDATQPFDGIFDGNGFWVKGVYANTKFSGLFGAVGPNGIVKKLTVKESFVKTSVAKGMAGGIAAYSKGLIEDVVNEAYVYGTHSGVGAASNLTSINCGGVVGGSDGVIRNAKNYGKVVAKALAKYHGLRVGGIVGHAANTVYNAQNYGYVNGNAGSSAGADAYVLIGGIAGYVNAAAVISECQNFADLEGRSYDSGTAAPVRTKMGGIAGQIEGDVTVEYSKNEGSLTGNSVSLHTTQSFTNVGGIVGRSYSNGDKIRFCENRGNINSTSSYSNTFNGVGGIIGYLDGVVEYCYASGKYVLSTSATSGSKALTVYAGGIAGKNNTAYSAVKGSYFAGSIASTVGSATSKVVHVGGLVGNNAGSITGSYFDSEAAGITAVTGNNTGTLTKSKALTTAEMQTNEFAWLLNTLGGDSTNSNVFSRYNSYPEFATDDQLPIYRVVFDDEVDIKNLYTSYKGYISAPTNPEPAPGEMFVGWTDGDKYMLQNRQVINKDMTLYALFTLVTEPIYTITFVDGKDVLVKATENDGKIANFPVAKNIPMGYHFDGWYDNATNKAVEEDMAFTGTATLIAKFSANLYKITFLDYDGSEISSEDVAYGTTPKAPKVTRESTEDFSYTLKGWTPDIDVVVGDASYTAVYDSTKIESSSSEEQVSSSSTEESSASVEKTSSSSTEVSSDSDNKSSSSEKASSSSVKPSSSSAKSSSSTKNSSSSAVKSSASSAKSSSSTSDKKSSSSKGGDKDAIYTIAQAPQFNVSVAGRTLQIAGAQSGAKISVFDLRGNVMYAGFVYASNINVEMPRSGSYLVRIGNQTQRVNVK